MLVFMDAVASVIRDGLGFITGPTTYHQPGQVVCILKQRSISTETLEYPIGQGWQTYGLCAQSGTQDDCVWHILCHEYEKK